MAAFQLHQCVESLYHTVMLVLTFYTPHSHNIKRLRGMAEKLDRRLTYVWPTEFHWQTAAFNILRDAYVKARYSKRGFKITEEQLRWLGGIAQDLAQVVREVCHDRIATLRKAAEETADPDVKGSKSAGAGE